MIYLNCIDSIEDDIKFINKELFNLLFNNVINSTNDTNFVNNVISLNNFDNNIEIFKNPFRLIDRYNYILDNKYSPMLNATGRGISSNSNVFIMLLREFCKEVK